MDHIWEVDVVGVHCSVVGLREIQNQGILNLRQLVNINFRSVLNVAGLIQSVYERLTVLEARPLTLVLGDRFGVDVVFGVRGLILVVTPLIVVIPGLDLLRFLPSSPGSLALCPVFYANLTVVIFLPPIVPVIVVGTLLNLNCVFVLDGFVNNNRIPGFFANR